MVLFDNIFLFILKNVSKNLKLFHLKLVLKPDKLVPQENAPI